MLLRLKGNSIINYYYNLRLRRRRRCRKESNNI